MNNKTVTIQILGHSYPVQCEEEEVSNLENGVKHINSIVHDIRKQAPMLEREQLLVLACLTITKDLLDTKTSAEQASIDMHALEKIVAEVKDMIKK